MDTIEYNDGIEVIVANASHEKYVDEILFTISEAAKVRGTGIAKRTHEYVAQKMKGIASWAFHIHEIGTGALHQVLLPVFALLFWRGLKEILCKRM